ncbi:MAG: 16S rRNA (uracil(1498)-N(3))-methyltransferase [Sulfuriflexus sp.]|nr:16S rRNA (uracil(1498)-N(3))-methyltransferase [Sulfuriflexus sp.]
MRISRLYIDMPLAANQSISISGEPLNYLANVLRLKVGAEVSIFNGKGGEFAATISELSKREAQLLLGDFQDNNNESSLDITLVQGISRGERMDFTLQKATELGVTKIIPLFTEHCTVSLKGERLEKRIKHWQGTVRSACEQSGRNKIPQIEPAQYFDTFIQNSHQSEHSCLLLDPKSTCSLTTITTTPTAVTLLIGPEGGFSSRERELAYANSYQGVQLGPRILRTETAAIAAISAMQILWGDLR